jgi:ATP/maltotriose-dependent transcriptional regulator MalT
MGATTLSVVHAFRGDEREAESLVADAEGVAVSIGARALLADAQFARATIAFSGGRYDEAFEHLQRTFDPHDPAYHHLRSAWRIGEFAEAAVHSGHLDEARHQLALVSQTSAGKRLPSRLGVGLMYAQALLADDDEAEAVFEAALDEDLASWPLYRARLLLQYGMWLRRRRKISQARMPLRAARDSLAALGATAWMERARQELRASRETQHNGPEARLDLTEQELQIAAMAAQGLSNREIAQRLYISPRTVGSHLYRIFPKLGVTSRTHLSMVLGNGESTEVAS